jgi:hypothetical protein
VPKTLRELCLIMMNQIDGTPVRPLQRWKKVGKYSSSTKGIHTSLGTFWSDRWGFEWLCFNNLWCVLERSP